MFKAGTIAIIEVVSAENFSDNVNSMNKRVNFEDSIFIIMMRIRMIRDTITLDAEPGLFLEKTLDDICFTEHSLRNLLEYLLENSRLIEREELLDHFSEAERLFSMVIQELLNHEGDLSIQEIPAIREKLIALRGASLERRKTAETLSSSGNNASGSPIVSSDELTELLKAL